MIDLTAEQKAAIRAEFETLCRTNAGGNARLEMVPADGDYFRRGQYEHEPTQHQWIGYSAACAQAIRRATPAPQAAPSIWKDALYADMDKAFHIREELGSDAEGGMVINDTQIGVEFAMAWIEKHFLAAPAVAITQAATSDKMMRHALSIAERVCKLGWDENGDEGAWEFVTRSAYKTGWDDAVERGAVQAATSEPVAMPQVELDNSLDTWMDVQAKDVPTWQRKGFNVRTLYAAPVAHLAGTTPNTEAPSDAKLWSLIDEYADARGEYQHSTARHLAKTQRENVEHAKAEVIAALSAQQAGVQEAPSGDAKDAARYRWMKQKRNIMLLTGFFGNGCVNRDLSEVDATIDAALAAATQTEKKPATDNSQEKSCKN